MSSDTALNLRRLLEALPQELYDQIYNDTFSATPAIRCVQDRAKHGILFRSKARFPTTGQHHPPKLMQVDQASRARFTASYYCNSIFVFPGLIFYIEWLAAAPVVEKRYLSSVCIRIHPDTFTLDDAPIVKAQKRLKDILRDQGEPEAASVTKYIVEDASSSSSLPVLTEWDP